MRWRLLIAVLLIALSAPAAQAETRAILIGVSRYESPAIPDLMGPANDLAAMEGLARSMQASDVVSLRDGAVSRSSVETALHDMGLRAQPGDWLLFYFSGHGAQALAQNPSDEDGEFDQFVPLPGFDPETQDPETFIIDKDFYAWMKRYLPPDVAILMVVDSCHSGTMHRAIDPRRYAFTPRIAFRPGEARAMQLTARPGPRLGALRSDTGEAQAGAIRRDDLPNLVYIGASRDDQLALETELPQEGAPHRGVLTYALEQAFSLPGANEASPIADLDGDGQVSVLEAGSYLNSQVRMLTAQRQESTLFYPQGWAERPLFSALPAPRLAFDLPAPNVIIAGQPNDIATAAGATSWRMAQSSNDADFLWVLSTGEVLRRSGDIVATGIGSTLAFAGVMDKWQTVMSLRPLVSELAMRLTVHPLGSDELYPEGTPISMRLERTRRGGAALHGTVFNLASDGTVQLIYPLDADGAGLIDAATRQSMLDSVVVPPFGVDHVIALATPEAPEALRAALRNADGQRASAGLAGIIRTELKRARGRGSLSIAELYTAP
ncbi:caspase family protein [Sphingomonas ursincola]|uniref:caspase family protein n=1 Tax=Sphingomonas ursincola TaxID=56361 RepID=UPI0023535076|nr:caspase family protein [Sphingomonas ursincola]MBY0621380.1 caspase family protein [Sphingomonas ursincola]